MKITTPCELGFYWVADSSASGGACARCKGPRYCSRVCQRQDWKRVHKAVCKRTGRLVAGEGGPQSFHRRATVARLLRKLRLYLAPFAVANEDQHQRQRLQQQQEQQQQPKAKGKGKSKQKPKPKPPVDPS